MKVELVYRRKHPCLKVMSNLGAVERERERERKRERERGSHLGMLCRDRLHRENKLDTDEDRRRQKIRTDC